jgi:MFS family permease
MTVYLVTLMAVLVHVAFVGSRVATSLYAINLGADAFAVGLLMSIYAWCPMVFAIYAGKLIDRVGARPPVLAGATGVMAALALPVVWPGLKALYWAAFLLGPSFMLVMVAVQGITGALGTADDRARNYSLLAVGFSISGFVGPLIAGFSIDHFGFHGALAALCVVAALALALAGFAPGLIPVLVPNEKAAGRSVMDLLRIPVLRRVVIVSGLLTTAWDMYQFFLPVYGHHIGLSASVIGMILATFSVATFAIRLFLPTMLRRAGEFAIMERMIFVASVAFALFPYFPNPWALAAISFLLGLGVGTGQPLSMSLTYAHAPKGRVSEAAGIRFTVNNSSHVVIPLIFGAIGSDFGFTAVFLSNAGMLFFCALFSRRR